MKLTKATIQRINKIADIQYNMIKSGNISEDIGSSTVKLKPKEQAMEPILATQKDIV